MSTFRTLATGLLRVLRYPLLVLFVYLATLVLSVPLAVAVRESIRASIGSSLVHEGLRQGFDMSWYGEYSAENPEGIAATFGPFLIGALPAWLNLERLLDGKLFSLDPAIVAAGVMFLLLWAFLVGGILDRFAHLPRVDLQPRFFAQCGVGFSRMLRLLLLTVALYLAFFRWGVGPLHEWVQDATRDVTSETFAILITAAIYAVVGLVLLFVKMVFDYAKIAIIVEGRSSVLLAVLRGLRFVFGNPVKTTSLYFLLLLAGLVLLALNTLLAPGAGQSSLVTILVAFLAGQVYLLARIVLKLWFLASQTVLFQSRVPGSRKA